MLESIILFAALAVSAIVYPMFEDRFGEMK